MAQFNLRVCRGLSCNANGDVHISMATGTKCSCRAGSGSHNGQEDASLGAGATEHERCRAEEHTYDAGV